MIIHPQDGAKCSFCKQDLKVEDVVIIAHGDDAVYHLACYSWASVPYIQSDTGGYVGLARA